MTTDMVRSGGPVIGYGYASVGRYGQGGLIRERFAPRLLAAQPQDLAADDGDELDPVRAWQTMMKDEKPGGHGERCVAVGALDMALWDAAAKITGEPLHHHLTRRFGSGTALEQVPVYASGGYLYPRNDIRQLQDEVHRFLDIGFTRVKIKIGAAPLAEDLRRIDAVARLLPDTKHLSVDAMNQYAPPVAIQAAQALAPLGLRWFEDVSDPHDFETQTRVAALYPDPIAAGEALFSSLEAQLLARHGGLRPAQDVLVFDPVHCYGLPGFLRVLHAMEPFGWPRTAFWPHGGHLFSLHVVAALKLGGAEVTPEAFHPFARLPAAATVNDGWAKLPDVPGIGFELDRALADTFRLLHD